MLKKQLVASFVKHLKENHKNTWRCIGFQFYNPNLSQEGCLKHIFTMQGYVQGAGSTKEATDGFFHKAFYKNC